MLRFVAPDIQTNGSQQILPGAYLIGPDSVPIAGEVLAEDGLIRCEKGTREAASLALQVDLDSAKLASIDHQGPIIDDILLRPLGVWSLQTCLLPDRDRAYLLPLELARHRIMLFLTKLEDWQSFDIPPDSQVMRLFDFARQAFTKALVASNSKSQTIEQATKHGLLALWVVLEASERLALLQTQKDFKARMNGELYLSVSEDSGIGKRAMPVLHPTRGGVVLPTKPAIGSIVSPAMLNDLTKSSAIKACDFITLPMRWIEMEPLEGEYAYTPTDQWIEWAIRSAKMPVVAGPVIDFRPACVPDWLYIWENDYDTLRELVYEHLKAIVTRYRRTVSRWTVCSGLHCGEHFKLDFQQMIDLTRICVLVVRKLHPRAKVQVEIVEPWGEYHTSDRRSLPPVLYAEMLTQSGIPIDSFSLRVQMGSYQPGLCTRDLMAFSTMLDQYAMLDRPIAISAFGVPSGPLTTRQDPENLSQPGYWRQHWTPQAQAQWLSAYGAVALSKPYIESICWQELADPSGVTEMRTGGLMDRRAQTRPVFDRVVELRDAIQSGNLPERLMSPDFLNMEQGESQAAEIRS
ncbi:MAG: endo-1,4-beta-xylanase [Phycisphaerales bacterium]|nr:endo-1,4-beta-xylanase [Phycisphaerales bacterium]